METHARAFVANGAVARLTAGPLRSPDDASDWHRAVKCDLPKRNRSSHTHPTAAPEQRWNRRHRHETGGHN